MGDSNVGKTCLSARFAEDIFEDNYLNTVDVNFRVRTKIIQMGHKCAKLHIWDHRSSKLFNTNDANPYPNVSGIIVVYDLTNQASFNNVGKWLEKVRFGCSRANLLLVGNKCDLPRQVELSSSKALADDFGIPFLETSAKNGANVENAFSIIANDLQKRFPQEQLAPLRSSKTCACSLH